MLHQKPHCLEKQTSTTIGGCFRERSSTVASHCLPVPLPVLKVPRGTLRHSPASAHVFYYPACTIHLARQHWYKQPQYLLHCNCRLLQELTLSACTIHLARQGQATLHYIMRRNRCIGSHGHQTKTADPRAAPHGLAHTAYNTVVLAASWPWSPAPLLAVCPRITS